MLRFCGYPTVALLLLGGCERMPSLPSVPTLTPYKIDIQQGNVVTQEMVEKLKPGMTPSQVRFILGTPLVVDAFHKDRWDYVYRFSKAGTLQESRRIVIVFKDDKLARIEGDVVAAQPDGVTIDKPAPTAAKPAAIPAPAQTGPEAASPQPEANKAGAASGDTAVAGAAGAAPASDAASAQTEKPAAEKPKEDTPKE